VADTSARGKFITFEGGEGAGKSTQVRRLEATLTSAGIDVLVTREPGGSAGAEEIRGLLVRGEITRWDAMSEALLLNAARRDHWIKTIEPALAAGTWVISDRFADSTLAYQGYGRGLSLELLRGLHGIALGDAWPDLTLILDLAPEDGLRRASARNGDIAADGEDRFERTGIGFHQRMRAGFLELAASEPDRIRVIDANATEETVALAVIAATSQALALDLT
jgi:dTMP kinase